MSLSFEAWQQRERALVVPPVDTREEFTGELLDYLRLMEGDRLVRAYLIHYAYDRRHRAHQGNPWVLWFVRTKTGYEVPAKMPLWALERCLAKRPLAWAPVPPAQGALF